MDCDRSVTTRWGNHSARPLYSRVTGRQRRRRMDSERLNGRRPFGDLGEHEPPPKKRPARSRAPPKLPPPLYKAQVKELANTGAGKIGNAAADVDAAIISRIKKCLDRANHPNTPEAEAKAALHMGSRLMGQYNVSQAEVLAQESASAQKEYAGQSIVSIVRFDQDMYKTVRHQTYVSTLCEAITTFFDCKSYSVSEDSAIDLVFYGIAENTIAAAMSFEMTFNLVAEWARPYKGIGSKNSYCHGVSDELYRDAMREKKNEELQAKKATSDAIAVQAKQEQADRAAQLARLATPPEPPSVVDINDGNGSNGNHDTIRLISLDTAYSETSNVIGDQRIDYGSDLSEEEADMADEDFVKPDFTTKNEQELNVLADLDDEIQKLIKPEPGLSEASFNEIPVITTPASRSQNCPSPKREVGEFDSIKTETAGSSCETSKLEPEIDVKWASHSQLVEFRKTAKTIADEYLKEEGVDLCKRSVRSTVIQDDYAYRQGKQDSKKINVHRKRIAN